MKNFILYAAILSTPLYAWAAPVTPEEALVRISGTDKLPAKVAANNFRSLDYVMNDESGLPSVYVFSAAKSSGFIIAPADDCAAPLLGYSESDDFDINAVPPALKWWLYEYSRQIEYARHIGATEYSVSQADWESVEPLISTKWNQSAPFNDLCPQVNGETSVTGCVATAMAQIVNYHKWPQSNGFGTYSYNYDGNYYSFDYESTEFDWKNMLDDYQDEHTADQAKAVATLMLACGVGVNMMYSPEASGAHSLCISRALIENFGYDKGAAYRIRNFYTDKDWTEIVYGELTEKRPVLYCGSDPAGGHAFVCDGYSENSFFHINWGWGGLADGYYMLSALNPQQQGIGGSALGYGFNYNQDIVTGIMPPVDNSSLFCPLYAAGPFSFFDYDHDGDVISLFGFNKGREYIIPYTAMETSIAFGLRIVDSNGEESFIFSDYEELPVYSNGQIYGLIGYIADYESENFSEGDYRVYPAVKDVDGNIHDIHTEPLASNYLLMNVDSEGAVTFSRPSNGKSDDIKVSHFEKAIDGAAGINPTYYISIRNLDNNSSFIGSIDISILESEFSENILQSDELSVKLPAGKEIPFTWEFIPKIEPGNYTVRFSSTDGEFLGSYPLVLNDYPKAEIAVAGTALPEQIVYDRTNMFYADIINSSEIPYNGPVSLIISHPADQTVCSVNETVVTLSENQEASLFMKWVPRESKNPEGEYLFSVTDMWGKNLITPQHLFLTSGIEEISIGDNDIFDIYTLQGIPVVQGATRDTLSQLGHGVYVIVSETGSCKIIL